MADDKEADADHHDHHDPHFEPLVNLPPVDIKTLEEDEDVLIKMRAKLFRYDTESEPPEWKERGTGDVKILQHREQGTCRVLMRRDKTHKICANHYVLPHMEMKPNCGSERAWVWSTFADFADEEPKQELLAIRFANAENAQKFKVKFDEARDIMMKSLNIVMDSPLKKDKDGSKDTAAADAGDNKDDKKQDSSPAAAESDEKKQDSSAADEKKQDSSAAEATESVADKLSELSVKETAEKSSAERDKPDDAVTGEPGDAKK